jgi:hypothetical protein
VSSPQRAFFEVHPAVPVCGHACACVHACLCWPWLFGSAFTQITLRLSVDGLSLLGPTKLGHIYYAAQAQAAQAVHF